MNIVFICDKNYIVPTSVTIYSIIRTMATSQKVTFYIITSSMDESIEKYFGIFRRNNIEMKIVHVSLGELENLHRIDSKKMCVATSAALLKFKLPEILTDCSKVLYLDGDIIVKKNIQELYNTDISQYYLAAVEDSGVLYSGRPIVKESSFYFNSGVMLLNLEKMREDQISEKLISEKKKSTDFTLMDQDIFNIVCSKKALKIGINYNYLYINLYRSRYKYTIDNLNFRYGTEYLNIQDGFNKSSIVHYSSKDKPWKSPYICMSRLWYGMLQKLHHEYGNEIENVAFKQYKLIKNYLEQYIEVIPPIVVSLTSFPERIESVTQVISSILSQSEIPDKVELWLADEEFPNKEDIPEGLMALCQYGLEIKYCDNIYSHKKYYYAMKENIDSIIITFDDDIYYDEEIISDLWNTHIKFPKAIAATRVHAMKYDPNGLLMPYMQWEQEISSIYQVPSINLFSTSGAGTLYPPALMSKEIFNKDNIRYLCEKADDVWLKFMQLLADIPVVLARPSKRLKLIKGTQVARSLCRQNRRLGGNDTQIENMLKTYENQENMLSSRLFSGYLDIVKNIHRPIVSVFISVFSEKCEIRRCLDSIISQSLWDIEIICIDNGSKRKILNEFQDNDERIKLLFVKQQIDRKEMLTYANGQYIFFANPNNWYEKDFLYYAYKYAGFFMADVVGGRCIYEHNSNNIKHYFNSKYEGVPKQIPFSRIDIEQYWMTYNTEFWDDKLFNFEYLKRYVSEHTEYKMDNVFNLLFDANLYFVDMNLVHVSKNTIGDYSMIDFIDEYNSFKYLYNDLRENSSWSKYKQDFYNCLLRIFLQKLYFASNESYTRIYVMLHTSFANDFDVTEEIVQKVYDYDYVIYGQIFSILHFELPIFYSEIEDNYHSLQKRTEQLLRENEKIRNDNSILVKTNLEIEKIKNDNLILLEEKRELEYCLSETRKSFSYKVGLFITIVPRFFRRVLKRGKEKI